MKLKRALLVASVLFILLTAGAFFTLRYIVTSRFGEVINVLVSQHSGNRYYFTAGRVDVSLMQRKIVVNDALLSCKDTGSVDHYYNVGLTELYLSVHSWRKLVFDKMLIIDSLAVREPSMVSVDRSAAHQGVSKKFHLTDVVIPLQKALGYLQLRAFSLTNGQLTMHKRSSRISLFGEGIDFRISNFSRKANNHQYFLFADDVDLTIKRQTMHSPDGMYNIAFSKLHFSGRRQSFEVDSIDIQSTESNPHFLRLATDKISFKSSDLTSVYEKEQVILDSLFVVRPVLTVASKSRQGDNVHAIRDPAKFLLAGLQFKYLKVEGGSVNLLSAQKEKTIFQTEALDLRMSDLMVDRITRKITAASIELDQQNINFITSDSLYEMNVGEFSFRNNNVFLKDATFRPTVSNHKKKELTFYTPVMQLNDISIEDLLVKKLHASHARLIRPNIAILENTSEKRTPDFSKAGRSGPFYRSLRSIHELIKVDSLSIVDGTLLVSNAVRGGFNLKINSLSALILLNRFFESDALTEIKHSLSTVQARSVQLHSEKLRLLISDYALNGAQAHNEATQADIFVPGQGSLTATGINWDKLDWDLMQNQHMLQVDRVFIDELNIQRSSSGTSSAGRPSKADLHDIRIGELQLNTVKLLEEGRESRLSFTARDIRMRDIYSKDRHLFWNGFSGTLHHLDAENSRLKLTADSIGIESGNKYMVKNLHITTSAASLSFPRLVFNAVLQSTDFSNIPLPYFHSNEGSFTYKTGKLNVNIPALFISGENFALRKNNSGIHFGGDLRASLHSSVIKFSSSDSNNISVEGLKASLNYNRFSSGNLDVLTLLNFATVEGGRLQYSNKKVRLNAGDISWQPGVRAFTTKNINFSPISPAETATDRLTFHAKEISALRPEIQMKDHRVLRLLIPALVIDDLALFTAKDRRTHAIGNGPAVPKSMPAALLQKIPFSLVIDTLQLRNGEITVHEIPLTGQPATIPLKKVSASLHNIKSLPEAGDSLRLFAHFGLFSTVVSSFRYTEAYQDSLHSFRASLLTSAMKLPEYTHITRSLVRVEIVDGEADSMVTNWSGNKHEASGKMMFSFKKLKVRAINPKQPEKRNLISRFKNFVANTVVIRRNNNKPVPVYFARDEHKSVFNFWIKTNLSGVIASVLKKKKKANDHEHEDGRQQPNHDDQH